MGCISSKLVSRSMSLQEKLKLHQSLQKRANGISNRGSRDHFHALVCSAKQVPLAIELVSGSFISEPNTCHEPTIVQLERNQEEEKQVQPASPLPTSADLARRSKSCHWFHDYQHEMCPLAPERDDGSSMGMRHARRWSFHTVEEYVAMVETFHFSRAAAVEQTGFDGREDTSLQLHCSKIDSEVENNTVTEEMGVFISNSMTTEESNVEKGFKRKTIANRLESLEIPSTIEFPGVSLSEWLHVEGQVDSPGTYVTPKFGSYALPVSEPENKCIEGTIFDPELVAAFHECMEQLEEEEEIILKQIEESFITDKEKKDPEEISSHQKEHSTLPL